MTAWHIELLLNPSNTPDLEHPRGKIDVKGVPTHTHRLISPTAAIKPDWLYLLVSAQEHPRYLIQGWCRGRVLATAPLRELQPRRWCHALQPGTLLPPQGLFNYLLTGKQPNNYHM